MRKKYRILLIISASIAFAMLGFLMFKAGKKIAVLMNEVAVLNDSVVTEYVNLFPENKKDQLEFPVTYAKSLRNPIGVFVYEGTTIFVYRFGGDSSRLLPGSIHAYYGKPSVPENSSYSQITQGTAGLNFRMATGSNPEQIIITLKTRPVSLFIQNDSISYLHVTDGEFSLKYGTDSAADIYTEMKDHGEPKKPIPMNILLLHRNGKEYLLLQAAEPNGAKLDDRSLLKLIHGK